MIRSIRLAGLLFALAWSGAASAQAPAACPPQLQAPTAAQMQAAAQTARDRGALWRISREGRSSYLFGTIHVGRLEWVMPGPQLRAALAATDTIALEIDPSDPQMAARMASAGQAGAAPTLSAALADRLARRLDVACLPASVRPALDAMHPVMKAMSLALLEARWEGLEASFGQEMALASFGRAAQRRLVSLETPESQLAALMPADAAELNQAIGGALDQLDKGSTRRSIARLAAAWERGDLVELAQYERWCECVLEPADRKLFKRLLDERNPALAERIDRLHRDGRTVLAGVGMLHMVGPHGLPELLRGRGYAVDRVPFP